MDNQDNLTGLHRMLYGPDRLLKPLAVLQDDLETSGLPWQDRVRAFKLAVLYWADVTHTPVSSFLTSDQEMPEVAARDRRARSPVPVR